MKSLIRRTSNCWIWIGNSKSPHHPYARIRNGEYVHRLAWELTRGPIPGGQFVLHKCDNMKCVRPSHLFLGTQADNMRDMVSKGRQAKGVMNHAAKLTPKRVKKIRSLLAGGCPQAVIARRFSVSQTAIYWIKNGRNWAHVQ